jgi:hypothetical protein
VSFRESLKSQKNFVRTILKHIQDDDVALASLQRCQLLYCSRPCIDFRELGFQLTCTRAAAKRVLKAYKDLRSGDLDIVEQFLSMLLDRSDGSFADLVERLRSVSVNLVHAFVAGSFILYPTLQIHSVGIDRWIQPLLQAQMLYFGRSHVVIFCRSSGYTCRLDHFESEPSEQIGFDEVLCPKSKFKPSLEDCIWRL